MSNDVLHLVVCEMHVGHGGMWRNKRTDNALCCLPWLVCNIWKRWWSDRRRLISVRTNDMARLAELLCEFQAILGRRKPQFLTPRRRRRRRQE